MSYQRNQEALKAKAVAYIRTSSAANVGADKDSDKRQRQAIAAFAKQASHELVGEFNDAAVSGADHIETRPGFAALNLQTGALVSRSPSKRIAGTEEPHH
jgi:hypothetical protein